MREADRDEQLAVADVVELVALPLAVGRRVAPQVDRDVPDPPADAADQLRLPGRGLEVQAAEDPPARARVVVLDELDLDPRLRPGRGAEASRPGSRARRRAPPARAARARRAASRAPPASSRCRSGARSTRGTRRRGSAATTTRSRGTTRPSARSRRRSETCGPPAERLGLRRGERVAAVVAEPVGDVLDQRLVAAGELEDPLHDLDVGQLVGPADVVDLARLAELEHHVDRRARSPSTQSQLRTCIPSP